MAPDLDNSRPPLPAFSRLSALFRRGEVIDLGPDPDGVPLLLWMNAMNAIEREEAVLDGMVAQALARQIYGPGSQKYEGLESELHESDRQRIIEAMLMSRSVDAWNLGHDDLHADEYWVGDRLLLVERGDASLESGLDLDPEQREAMAELNTKYLADWKTKAAARVERMRREYEDESTAELITKYLAQWTDSHALRAQANEYRITQLFFSTRTCLGTPKTDGGFRHDDCGDHGEFVFPNRESVRRADDALLERLIPVADRIEREGGDALGKR